MLHEGAMTAANKVISALARLWSGKKQRAVGWPSISACTVKAEPEEGSTVPQQAVADYLRFPAAFGQRSKYCNPTVIASHGIT